MAGMGKRKETKRDAGRGSPAQALGTSASGPALLCAQQKRGNSWRKMSAQGWAMWPVSLRSKASLSLLAFLLFLLTEAETSNHNAGALI